MKINQPFYKAINKRFLRLDAQYFTGGDPEPPANPNPSPPPNPEPLKLTLEAVQSFVSDDDNGKKWLQSLTDTRVTDAIKTYETKTLPKKLDDEIAKRFPNETEEQKQLRDLQQKFENLELEKTRETLKNKALSIATEKALPTQLVDYFIGRDEESTIKNLGTFEEVFSAAVQAGVEEKFKSGGRDPKPPATPNGIEAQLEDARKRAMQSGRQEDRVAYANLKMQKELQGK